MIPEAARRMARHMVRQMLPRLARWRGLLLLALLGLLVFGNALSGPFHYDDLHSIQYNPHIRNLAEIPRHFVDPATFSSRVRGYMYRPLLMTSYSLDYALWGDNSTGFRLVNLLLHVIASALFGRLAARWIGRGAGVGAAVLILVHPLHSEAVDYISSRSDLLVAVFSLAALVTIRAARPWPVLLLYVGAALSKSVAVTMPAIAVVLTIAEEGWRGLLRDRWRYAGLAVLSIGYLGILWSTRFLTSSYEKLPRSPLTEFWTQAKALVYYGWLSGSPVHLNVDHAFSVASSPTSATVVLALALVLSVLLLSLRYHRQLPAKGVFFFAVAMLPYMLVPLNIVVSERRTYLASCGLFLIGIWAWRAARQRWGTTLRPVGLGLCAVLVLLTLERNEVWATDIDLWRDAVLKNPVGARPRLNLALALKRNGYLFEAGEELREGLRLDPEYAEGWVVLGQLRQHDGDSAGALDAYRRGAALDPTMAGVYHDLGNVAMHLGRIDSAIVHYQHVLQLAPRFAEARNNLGMALEAQGHWAEALDSYRHAVRDSLFWTNTDDPVGGAWYNRARAAEHLGFAQEAMEAWFEAQKSLVQDARYVDRAQWAQQQWERLEQR